jgi:hypothetical protein
MRRNKDNFRLFGPDESQSNRLDATYEVTQKAWAASGLDAACPDGTPGMPSARLQAIEARLDSTWVAVQTIQVAVAQFQKQLSDQQRARFNALQLRRSSSTPAF